MTHHTKYIIGLGNPGKEYQETRHNVGWMFLDHLVAHQQAYASWSDKKKFRAHVLKMKNVVLVKPQTYMNESGQAVRAVLDFFQPNWDTEKQLNSVLVVYDDLDLPTGTTKLQFAKGPKVHNGLQSVMSHLGGDQFWHARIGIDGRAGVRNQSGRDYVLQPFLPTEQRLLEKAIVELTAVVVDWVDAASDSLSSASAHN